MKRVLVLGCSGSGKSTLTRQLAHLLGIPDICLDKHYWQPGWQGLDAQSWRSIVRELVAQPAWVMDGIYNSTLPLRLAKADTVIFLDFPRYRCLSRVILRTIRNYGRVRESMPAGCPERIDAEFFQYIWNFEKADRPILMETLRHFDGTTHTFRSDREVSAFLGETRGKLNR